MRSWKKGQGSAYRIQHGITGEERLVERGFHLGRSALAAAIGRMNEALKALQQCRICDLTAACSLFFGALITQLNTVLNNAYSFGSTLFDSGIEQSILWRSGWLLTPARVFERHSYFELHLSPILYIPQIVSYLVPIDRMTYYGLVYGVVWGSLLVLVYKLLKKLPASSLVACIGSVAFYISGPVAESNWEPHQEIISSLMMIAFFMAWATDRHILAVVSLSAHATVREDCGVLLALPLICLWLLDKWERIRSPEHTDTQHHATGKYALLSLLCSMVTFAIKARIPTTLDTIDVFYYSKAAPFSHLSWQLLAERVHFLIGQEYMIAIAVVLATGSIVLRDWRPFIGWLAFLPYFIFSFLSKMELAANFGSYKGHPYFLTLVWPAILAAGPMRGDRRRLYPLQIVLLFVSVISIHDGAIGIHHSLSALVNRWVLHTENQDRVAYQGFEPRLAAAMPAMGRIKGSQGAIALYPDLFDAWYRSSVTADDERGSSGNATSLLWFAGDRDAESTRQWLAKHPNMRNFHVIGTKLVLSTSLNDSTLAPMLPFMQKID